MYVSRSDEFVGVTNWVALHTHSLSLSLSLSLLLFLRDAPLNRKVSLIYTIYLLTTDRLPKKKYLF